LKARTCRGSNDSMGDLLTQVSLSGLLHLRQDHGTNFLGSLEENIFDFHNSDKWIFTYEFTCLVLEANLDSRLPTIVDDIERPVLHISLQLLFVHFTTNETLSVENGVLGIGVVCVLGGVPDTRTDDSQYMESDTETWITYSRSSSVKLTHEGVIR
jgi:hypothetical protein